MQRVMVRGLLDFASSPPQRRILNSKAGTMTLRNPQPLMYCNLLYRRVHMNRMAME